MNFIIITSFLIFSAVFFFSLRRTNRIEAEQLESFWEREKRANFTRKKSLDSLNYITIPDSILNMKPSAPTDAINDCIKTLNSLSSCQIVNLTGYTNTDLKLEYGTANITILSDFDLNYTNLVSTLHRLAKNLIETGDNELAMQVLEFAVSTGTDVSKSYYLLADLYEEAGTPGKISALIKSAQGINSIMKDVIIQKLNERITAN